MSEQNDPSFDDTLDALFQGMGDVDPGPEFEHAVLREIRGGELRRRWYLFGATVIGAIVAMISLLPLADILLDWMGRSSGATFELSRVSTSDISICLVTAVVFAIIGCLALSLDEI